MYENLYVTTLKWKLKTLKNTKIKTIPIFQFGQSRWRSAEMGKDQWEARGREWEAQIIFTIVIFYSCPSYSVHF